MGDRREPDARVQQDLFKLKQRIRSLEAERAEYVDRMLRDRLRHPDDFERFIGLATVEDADGRIDWLTFEQRLAALLSARPELAA